MWFKHIGILSFICVSIIAVASMSGCWAIPKKSFSPRPLIQNASTVTTDVAKGIEKTADNIDTHVDQARKQTPDSAKQDLEPHYRGIQNETGFLRDMQAKLKASLIDLLSAHEETTKLEEHNKALMDKVANLEAEKNSAIQKMMAWLIVSSVIGLGVCGVLLYMGNRIGVAGALGCVTVLATAILIGQYMMWFAIGAGALIVVMLLLVGWEAYRKMTNENRLTNTAKELVETVEASKMTMDMNARRYLFGDGAIPGQVDVIQSSDTKDFVKNVRHLNMVKMATSSSHAAPSRSPSSTTVKV